MIGVKNIRSLFKRNRILIVLIAIAAFLRLYKLDQIPVSLYIDELDLGYQAYSILHTGRDYFGNLLPLHPHSFAEYRTPFNIYSAIPTVAIFGINALGVRIPSVIFGILGVIFSYLLFGQMLAYKTGKNALSDKKAIALMGTAVLVFSPWHIQFSRVTLEVSALFSFLTLGLYFFFKSFKASKVLWLSALFLGITPWIYSTAKVFVPLMIVFLFLNWRSVVLKIPKKELLKSVIVLLFLGLPMIYLTMKGEAGSRFNYISVFSDPTVSTQVNYAREFDAVVQGRNEIGTQPTLPDVFFHNKVLYWVQSVVSNYLDAISVNFLFFTGDPNLRHSPSGVGQFHWIELIPLLFGIILFFGKFKDVKVKKFLAFWIIAGIFPAAITRDGGSHAPRLILILAPLVFIISYGLYECVKGLRNYYKIIFAAGYGFLWTLLFSVYLHTYFVHYPWDSERWWDYGYEQVVGEVKRVENNYEKVIITKSGNLPPVYFAAYYTYNPNTWQKAIKSGDLYGSENEIKTIGKFSFYQYESDYLADILDTSTLYVASASEFKVNFIIEPESVPEGLELVRSITYPSGEPVFYMLTKSKS